MNPDNGVSATQRESRFERDVLPLSGQLFGAAMRLTRNTQDAEDLLQEVMLRAFTGFDSFHDGTNPKAWLYRILHNTWVSQHRRKKCRPDEVSVDFTSDGHLAAGTLRDSNASRSAEDSALESVAGEELTTAFAALREEVRETVYYADVLDLSYREIAAIVDCPIGTVMSRLHRGRNRLRSKLIAAGTRRDYAPQRCCADPLPAA